MHKKLKLSMVVCLLGNVVIGCTSPSPHITQPGIVQVGPSGYGFRNPVWSPDGKKIAVTTQTVVSSWTSEIFIIDVSTGKKKSVMYTDFGSVMAISWSPDGSQILLASQKGGDWPEGIWTINADGKSSAELLAEGYDAARSPDGKKLAMFFHSPKSAYQDVEISIINLETKDREVIFGGKASNVIGGGLAWSHSGRELIFDYGLSGVGQLDLYILNVVKGK